LKGKEEKESSDYFNDFKYLENDWINNNKSIISF
jgi:hypothetical protein